jgi:hypothetical protein
VTVTALPKKLDERGDPTERRNIPSDEKLDDIGTQAEK